MMSALRSLQQARRVLSGARSRLLNPSASNVLEASEAVRATFSLVKSAEMSIASATLRSEERAQLQTQVGAIRRELKRIKALLNQAHKYYGLSSQLIFGEMLPEAYDATGTVPAQPATPIAQTVVLHG